jgi:2,3-bisphosphoglycerate-independent phosphoglycerate mutase
MAQRHPDTKYILTINVGVVDSAGHYRGVDGYIDSIEGLDSNLEPVYEAARNSNTAFVITADHGMAFKTADAPRGGHASDEYYSSEAITVPVIMVSPNLAPGTVKNECDQADIAPTLLSILDLPGRPNYADGQTVHVKDYVSLGVSSDVQADVEIFQENDMISRGTGDSEYIFTGLAPKVNYTIKFIYNNEILEQTVYLNEDRMVRFETAVHVNDDKVKKNDVWRKRIASLLIFLVIVAGLLAISRIKE